MAISYRAQDVSDGAQPFPFKTLIELSASAALSTVSYQVFADYFGIEQSRDMSIDAIAARVELTTTRCRQLLDRALEQILAQALDNLGNGKTTAPGTRMLLMMDAAVKPDKDRSEYRLYDFLLESLPHLEPTGKGVELVGYLLDGPNGAEKWRDALDGRYYGLGSSLIGDDTDLQILAAIEAAAADSAARLALSEMEAAGWSTEDEEDEEEEDDDDGDNETTGSWGVADHAQPITPDVGKPDTDQHSVDWELFAKLRSVRGEIATENGFPAYMVFRDRTLEEMSTYFPHTEEDFLAIWGVGQRSVDRYSNDFLPVIRQHCQENGIEPTPMLRNGARPKRSRVRKSLTRIDDNDLPF